jgi:branched-chain amino acid transport system permease protein
MNRASSARDALAVPARARAASVGLDRLLRPALLLALAGGLPFVLSDYRVFQLTLAGSYAIALLGLNLLTGFNGQISLGHGAFLALGAYTAAILMEHAGMPYWATVPVAGAVCLAAGFLFGLPALRLQGPYLALATFALSVAMPQLLKHKSLEHWTGGVQGIVLTKPDAPPWLAGLSQDRWLYFFTLAWALLMFVLGWNLVRGRIGRALVALREQPVAAQAMGVNAALVKSLTFGVSALYAGVSGALGAVAVQFVAPDSFNVFLSLSLVVGIVVGGLATIQGAVWGALFIQFMPNVADQLSKAAPWAIYGLLLIVFTVFMPGGIASLTQRLGRKRPHQTAAGSVTETMEDAR